MTDKLREALEPDCFVVLGKAYTRFVDARRAAWLLASDAFGKPQGCTPQPIGQYVSINKVRAALAEQAEPADDLDGDGGSCSVCGGPIRYGSRHRDCAPAVLPAAAPEPVAKPWPHGDMRTEDARALAEAGNSYTGAEVRLWVHNMADVIDWLRAELARAQAVPAPTPAQQAEQYTLDQIADACMYAEVSDGKYESISIALKATRQKPAASWPFQTNPFNQPKHGGDDE